jgi:anti-sigma B factor antagonist
MQPILENANKNIVLDCTKMEFISSSGLRLFLAIRKQALADGGNVTIKGASQDVKQVFTITGFTALFKFTD